MIPPLIGRYQTKRELGRGGMAAVYEAFDPEVERDVAIKVLPREAMLDPNFRARFKREAKIIAALEHPGIVPIYDFGEHDGQPYIVMRLMSGGSLQDRIKKGGLPLQECARIYAQLAPALDDAHDKGIVHRDLKPGNILFDQRNIPYISDFGIAKLAEATMVLTINGLIGTPAYMSPEQARGENVIDGRADVYSLGVILYEMLTGKLPFNATTPLELALKHVTEPVPRLLSSNLGLPADAQKVIDGAMAKDKDERFTTAAELAGALGAVSRGEPIMLAPPVHPLIQSTIAVSPRPRGPTQNPIAPSQPAGMPMWMWVIVGFLAVLVSACAGLAVLAAVTNAPALTGLFSFLTPASPTALATTVRPSPSASALVDSPSVTPGVTPQAGLTPVATECNLAYTLESIDPPAGAATLSGEPFVLTVSLVNAGDCAWPAGTKFAFDQGDPLNAPSAIDVGTIAPGQAISIDIPMQAPPDAGTAAQSWTLRLPDGAAIGDPIEFDYTFETPTATPQPPTRAPTRPPVAATTPAPPPPTLPPSSGGPITVRRVNFVSAVRSGGDNANATLSIEFAGGTGPFTLTGDGILNPQPKNVTGTFENAGVIYSYIFFERITSCGAAVAARVTITDSVGQSALHLYNVNIVCQ
jgi:serine/threonine protein kinase